MAENQLPPETTPPVVAPQAAVAEIPAPAAPNVAPLPPVLLKGEIEIYPDQRLPHLDQGPVRAYAASGRAKEKSFALVCERPLVPQINNASKYITINTTFLPRLLGAGLVQWAPTRQQRYVFVYENKLALPFANPTNFMAMGYKPDVVLHGFVKKFVPFLKMMRDQEFVHGNIRVTNLFTGGGGGFERIMLGECLTTPPGYMYSPIYETIERSVAQPIGRGNPDYSDDLYSFGVMLAVLIRNVDPLAGWSDEDVVQYKIEHGSFQALTGKERFPGVILELLRGLLVDDVKQRWTIDDIVTWVDGQRVSPKQASPLKPKAARPIEFFGEKYLRPQVMALNLHKNAIQIVKLNDNGELKLWLNRSIQDKALEDNVEHAANAAKELGVVGESYPERAAAYIAAAMAPNAPVLYRHLKFMPQAFGRLLAEAFALNKDLTFLAEILQTSLINFWATMHDVLTPEIGEIINKFEACKTFLRQSGQGYGLERCLYFLCSEAPCMSEKLKDFYVRTPEEFAFVYEQLSGSSSRPEGFFDRHIIAFLSVKDRSVIDPYIPDLNSSEIHRNVLGALRIFSAIQRRGKMPMLPGITSWLADKMDPVINRFHDRDQRAKLKAQLSKMKDKGEIAKLEQVFDDAQAIQMDYNAFRQNMITYVGFKNEYKHIEHELANNPKYGYEIGHQAAALASGIIATLIVVIYLFFKLSHAAPF